MSFFSSKASSDIKPCYSPVDAHLEDPQATLFGPLEANDLYWTCAGGFVTETQTFYFTRPTGQVAMFQVIHSAVGLWNPNIQLTFGYFDNSASKEKRKWKSINVSHFKCPPPANAYPKPLDKRSSKGDQFHIIVDPDQPDTYLLEGKYDNEVQVSLQVTRAPNAPGWKLGTGRRGGMTYFGTIKPATDVKSKEPDASAGSDGYVVHRFWPRTHIKGIIRVGQEVIDMEGSRGVMIHAIQGMRPNLIASRWNFCDFQSKAEDGVSLVQMEFTTTSTHGHKVVNVGSIVVDDKLVAVVVGGTKMSGGSTAQHKNLFLDKDTEYNAPQQILFTLEGPSIDKPSSSVKATLNLELGQGAKQGLAEKVDVLAEIPYFIKKVVNVVSGAKPYIYQWLNPITATISLPAFNGQEARDLQIQGHLFNEASYVSETSYIPS